MRTPAHETPPSWICRNEAQRTRFMDLHDRLMGGNNRIMVLLIVAIAACFPLVEEKSGLVPVAVGLLRDDPLALPMFLVAILAVHIVATVLRDSDVEHRGAAILDPLTGMLNRAALTRRREEIEHQSAVTGEPMAIIVVDLDRFKDINDEHGHAVGDTVLQEVAYRMRKQLRAYDLAYRLGGEEFAVLLLGGTAASTRAAADALRAAIADGPIAGIDVTSSLGVAASEERQAFSRDEIFGRADAALYEAKAQGRDRVVIAGAEVSLA